MFIKSLYLGVCMTNCYIVSGDNKSCIVIDPASDAEIICNEIAKYNFVDNIPLKPSLKPDLDALEKQKNEKNEKKI